MGKVSGVVSDRSDSLYFSCPSCGGAVSMESLSRRTRGASHPDNVSRIKERVRQLQKELESAEEVSGEYEIQQA